MMSDLKTLVSCRICGGEFSDETLILKDSPLANELNLNRGEALLAEKFPLQVVMCSTCKHFQLKHIVSQIAFSQIKYSNQGHQASFENISNPLPKSSMTSKKDIN